MMAILTICREFINCFFQGTEVSRRFWHLRETIDGIYKKFGEIDVLVFVLYISLKLFCVCRFLINFSY